MTKYFSIFCCVCCCAFAAHLAQAQVAPAHSSSSSSSSARDLLSLLSVNPTGVQTSSSANSSLSSAKITRIKRSERDKRDYRYITLNNQLRVLLISDPKAEKSAAALNVAVGSHNNPKQRPGLAHFLEHMLFLGTEKYPQAGDYQDFITQHGGDNNAYTAEENTNYFFEIEHSAFEPALDRFAQFFIAPLFDAHYVDREKNAVNAEYLAKINDDERREWDVLREIFNAEHPAANFSVGSLASLADQDKHSIRDDLVNFYQTNYSANLMTLVVLSPKKIDELQKLVQSKFDAIPNKNITPNISAQSLFQKNSLPLTLKIKPYKELRQLNLYFPTPSFSEDYKSKPWEYITQLLGADGSGSLIQMLKNLGWAESIQVGNAWRGRSQQLFTISISLTPEGLKARNQIISCVFAYLKLVSAHGVSEWRFSEMRQLAELNFHFQEKQKAQDVVSELAQSMQDYPANDVLIGAYDYTKYNEDLILQALSYLNKNNMLESVIDPKLATDKLSSFYQTPYASIQGVPEILDLKPNYALRLFLPDRNLFIPKNLVVKPQPLLDVKNLVDAKNSARADNVPIMIQNTGALRLWFLQDTRYNTPKAELNLRFKLPVLNGSIEQAARMQLYVAMLNDLLVDSTYPAQQAGLTFEMKSTARGFDFHVSGFSDRQALLINKIIDVIEQPTWNKLRFEKIKEDMLRELRNEEQSLPFRLLAKKISRLQVSPNWSSQELVDALQKQTFENMKIFAMEFLTGAKVEGLYYGNLYQQDAIKVAALIDRQLLQKQFNRGPLGVKIFRLENRDNKSWLLVKSTDHKDQAVELYIQSLSPTVDDAANMLLASQILEAPFYNSLRTEKQLGYIVGNYSMPLKSIEGSLFVVQSPTATSEQLIQEIHSFLSTAAPLMKQNFEENKASLLSQLRETPVSLSEQSEKFWQSLIDGDWQFVRQQELIDAVARITPESLTKYYNQAFLPKGRRLWLSTSKPETLSDFELIQNESSYQAKQQSYLYP